MKRKNIIILLTSITLTAGLGSVALFTSLDIVKNNYIKIGKIKKQVENLKGYIFEYSNVHKDKYTDYEKWKVDIAKNTFDSVYKTGDVTNVLYLSHDLNELSQNIKSSYVAIFDAKDKSINSKIDPATMKLNIMSNSKKKEYSSEQLKPYSKFFDFDKSKNKYIPTTDQTQGGQSVLIDLKQFLDTNTDTTNTTVTLQTSQGDYTLNMGNLSGKTAKVVVDLYEYNNYQRLRYKNYSEWLSDLSDIIFKKFYAFDTTDGTLSAERIRQYKGHSNYVAIVHGANFNPSNTFAKKDLSIEIKTPSTYKLYTFDELKSKAMFYDYYEDYDAFYVDEPGLVVDALFVDLKDILEGHLSEKFIKLKINTTHSDIYFNIK